MKENLPIKEKSNKIYKVKYAFKLNLHFYLNKFINWLQVKNKHLFNETEEIITAYTSLSPIDNADTENKYSEALKWALDNRKEKDIKNIALTGPYGSGKSSVLKTFQKNNSNCGLHFLNISLATFKEENDKEEKNSEKENTSTDLLRLIELSILQQIFYHEDAGKIPDSRFKKIKSYSKFKIRLFALFIMIYTLSILCVLFISKFEELSLIVFDSVKFSNALYLFSIVFIPVFSFFLVSKITRNLVGLKVSKFNIQNLEFGIDDNISKSILNHHIDEILYFFEVTPYNVVIIEDLDRFQQTEIFTKLRELNLLINNSKRIQDRDRVVFIYAVRDDMFKEDKERTKFFDFIIPVIPVINSSNSSQKLLEIKSKNRYNISEDLIETISVFIDDMRVLYNIMNEYYLYHQEFKLPLIQDKLLGMLVYKNIFPSDFTLLSRNDGVLFNALNDKQYIKDEIVRLDDSITKINENINAISRIQIKDIKELRKLYLLEYVDNISNFQFFYFNNTRTPISTIVGNEDYFNLLTTNNFQYKSINGGAQNITTSFSEIENKVDDKFNYLERKEQIDGFHSKKLDELKKQIQELEKQKAIVKNLKIRDLLLNNHSNIKIEDFKQKNLVNLLLLNGYIDEDYLDYISIFYEGSISKEDNQFWINVKTQTHTDFNFKLNKIANLINKINYLDFEKEFILNFDLMDYCLLNSKHYSKRDFLFTRISNESKLSIQFIVDYIERGKNVKEFVIVLINRWPHFWKYIVEVSNFEEERKLKYFQLIIEYAELPDIKRLSEYSSFEKSIQQTNNFTSIIQNSKKIKEIIELLHLKFEDLDSRTLSDEMLDFIYENNYYEINIEMITLILKRKGKYVQQDFKTKNYFAITNCNLDKLQQYLSDNIDDYIQNIYLKIDSNNNEDERIFLDLIESVSEEDAEKVIKQVNNKIGDISEISYIEVKQVLLTESKVIPTWNNIFSYYRDIENQIDKYIVEFINVDNNAKELSLHKIPIGEEEEKLIYSGFITNLLKANQLNDNVYSLVVKSIPNKLDTLSFSEISEKKTEILISNHSFDFNYDNYNSLKSIYNDLHIKFLIANIEKFLSIINEDFEFKLDKKDVLSILKSKDINDSAKEIVLSKTILTTLISEDEILKQTGLILLTNVGFNISFGLLEPILKNNILNIEQRIRIFISKQAQLDQTFIKEFLSTLGEPYSDILLSNKEITIDYNHYSSKMVEILKSHNLISKINTGKKTIVIRTPNIEE